MSTAYNPRLDVFKAKELIFQDGRYADVHLKGRYESYRMTLLLGSLWYKVPARRIKDMTIVEQLLQGIGLIEKSYIDPKLGVVVLQLFSAKATEQAIKQKTFCAPGGITLHVKERPAAGYALGGDIPYDLRSKEGVTMRCNELLKYANETANSETEANIFENLEKLIRSMLPEFANLCMRGYGSRKTGLRLRGKSDADLFIGQPGQFHSDNLSNDKLLKNEDVSRLTDLLVKEMKLRPNLFGDVQMYNNVKCTYLPNNLDCDFSFMNGLNFKNSVLISKMLQLDSRARQLCLYMKHWTEENGIRFYYAAYLSTLMVIFYLQRIGMLPAVSKWQNGAQSSKIGDWECGMIEKIDFVKDDKFANTTAADLVAGFFKYYCTFSYNTDVICVYSGSVIQRSTISSAIENRDSENEGLPPGIRERIVYADAAGYSPKISMFIMGPFDYNNAARQRIGESPEIFDILLQLFKKSNAIIEKKWRRA